MTQTVALRDPKDLAWFLASYAGERTGWPLGSEALVAALEKRLDRPFIRRKPGPKPKRERDN